MHRETAGGEQPHLSPGVQVKREQAYYGQSLCHIGSRVVSGREKIPEMDRKSYHTRNEMFSFGLAHSRNYPHLFMPLLYR